MDTEITITAQQRASRKWWKKHQQGMKDKGFKNLRFMLSPKTLEGIAGYQKRYNISSREKALEHFFTTYPQR